jgi:DNA-binding transcriptional LysR family regulator
MGKLLGNLHDIDLRLLRVFRSIVQHGGFAAAKDDLGLMPSTISIHMSSLEHRLGVKLCHRGRGGFRLTNQGKQVHDAMLDLFGSLENFRSSVGATKGELSGAVEFGAVDALYTNEDFPLEKAIGEFARSAPNVILNLHLASPQELLQGLLMGRFHIILTPAHNLPNTLDTHFVYREYQRLYCGSKHPLYNCDDNSITSKLLSSYPYVDRSYETRDRISAIDFNKRAEVSFMESALLMILSGEYIGFLPDHFARSHVQSNRLRSVLPESLSFHDDFKIALHKRRKNAVGQHMAELVKTCTKEIGPE